MWKFTYGFSIGIPLHILMIYCKDPDFKGESDSVTNVMSETSILVTKLYRL